MEIKIEFESQQDMNAFEYVYLRDLGGIKEHFLDNNPFKAMDKLEDCWRMRGKYPLSMSVKEKPELRNYTF